MKQIQTVKQLRRVLPTLTDIALVPTMGNLHAGHLALVKHAQQQARHVVVSIFVNPLQFGANEDFADYPRTLAQDIEKLEKSGVALLFAPRVADMYPRPLAQTTQVQVPELSDILCGASRRGHFVGVTTVVNKLFNLVQPKVAVFGQKDYQQLLLIQRMVEDLAMPIQILAVPTHREADGLAMSSRNGYLSAAQRAVAPQLYRSLTEVKQHVSQGERDFARLEQTAIAQLQCAGFVPDYVSIRHAQTLATAQTDDHDLMVLAAAKLGKTRLIDNLAL